MSRTAFLSILAAAALTAMTATAASAIPIDKLTYVTFSGPVQIPGAILDPGTYRFHLANPDTGRNVVQVLSNDGAIVYSMFHTIPDFRTVVTDETTVTFREAPANVAPPIKSLFYGGESNGYEFLYGRGEPNMTPMFVWTPPQPTVSYTPNAAPAAPAYEPAPEPAISTPVVTEPAPEPLTEPPATLPKTASQLPLTALGGLVSIVAGLGIGLLRRR